MFASPEFWFAVAVAIFAVLTARPIFRAATAGLDKRADSIRSEIEEARRLREEAQKDLAEFQRRQRDAVKEAETMMEHAREEAKRIREQAGEELKQALARREQQAKDRIAQSEAEAVAEVRTAAVDLAISAAGKLMAENLDANKQNALTDEAISNLSAKLH